jgi:hypothetical protein
LQVRVEYLGSAYFTSTAARFVASDGLASPMVSDQSSRADVLIAAASQSTIWLSPESAD